MLGNRNGIKGAAVILYEGLLKEMAKSLESDLLILPSSIHEILVMAYDNEVDLFLIKDMVESVSISQKYLCVMCCPMKFIGIAGKRRNIHDSVWYGILGLKMEVA